MKRTSANDVEAQLALVRECYLRARHNLVQSRLSPNTEIPPVDLVTHNPGFDGGVDPFGRKHKPVWPKLLEFLVRNKFSPLTYFDAVMRHCNGNPFSPQFCYSETAANMYLSQKDRRCKALEVQEKAQVDRYQQEYLLLKNNPRFANNDDREIAVMVLGNHLNGLTPVFRYCLASRLGLEAVKQDWRMSAIEKYVYASDLYDQLFGDLIPADLRQKAAEARTFSPRNYTPPPSTNRVHEEHPPAAGRYRPVQD